MIFLDIETRSRVDLRQSNVYRYVTDPDFTILMLAWAQDDGPVSITTDRTEMAALVRRWLEDGQRLVAHNAAFERVALSALLGMPEGQYLEPHRFDDSMVLAAEHGYPASLDALAQWLGGETKDSAGTRLINLFSKPGRTGDFTQPEDKPEQWRSFLDYCIQDVVTLRGVYRALPEWPTESERAAWLVDQRINDRGIPVDVPMVDAAVKAADMNRMVQEVELSALTGVANPGSTQQLLAWFQDTGLPLPNLQAGTVAAALEKDGLSDDHRRALELRKELALVASKKYTAATDRTNADDRLRGSFQFFGAHTGRWAGRGVQLQNLPAATIQPAEGVGVDAAIEAVAVDLKMGLGADSHALKAMVRSMFQGPFTVVDYSAIEARVVAWLADERWALDAFAAGRDIYVETAKRMGGLSRKEGKVATLALGYNGGVNSLRAMGAEGTDDHLQTMVTQWREANENITALWREADEAFWTGGPIGKRVRVEKDGTTRRLRLPSGRAVTYHAVRRVWGLNRWGNESPQLSFRDPKRGGARVDTYGGRLVENITQAIARDVLTDALVALERAGYSVVGHVHDEVILEGLEPIGDVAEVMTTASAWAAGLPLDAEGYQCARYRKD